MKLEYSVNQRLKKFTIEQKISQADFARKTELNDDIISKWFREAQRIPFEHLIKIINCFPDLDVRWLLTGESAAPAKSKPYYKPDDGIDVANDGKDCCRRCKDLENQIELYKKVIALYENPPKKETPDADSVQLGEGAKQRKIK